MKNSVQKGEVMTFPVAAAIESGEPLQIGTLVGVAAGKYAIGDSGELVLVGVVKLKKASALVVAQGAEVQWETSTKEVVVGTGDFVVGKAFKAAANGETTIDVLLPLGPGGGY